jgi:tetratricopeptide (TPR) repeat protein
VAPSPRARYGVSLVLIAALILAAAGVAVATLLREDPALQVNVFGIAGRADRARQGAADVLPARAGLARGRIPADLGLPLAFRYPTGPAGPATPYAGWTTLGLDVAQSRALDRARRLAQAGQAQAAIALYDSLLAQRPENDDVAVERARVLSWSGSTEAAGEALAAVAARRGDPALRLEAARNLYWAARFERADALLEAPVPAPPALAALPAAGPGGASRAEALAAARLALRDSVRRADNPSVARARRWVREHGGAMENLALARAYLRERQPGASLAPYAEALRLGARDSLRLELASAALEADSPAVAARALGGWLERYPADRATRLQRARALAWARDYPAASAEYGRVLEGRDDPAVRYELAEAQTWAGDSIAARATLERVLAADAQSARAWRLLGDLDRWAGRWALSLASYARAKEIDPALEGIDAGLAEDREGLRRLRQARVAGIPAAAARVEGMGDSEGFRWSSVEAAKTWADADDGSTLALRARTERVSADVPGGGEGFALAAEGARPLGPRLRASASLGAEAIADRVQPTAAAELAWADTGGASAALRVVREPAVRRTATVAAVEAGVVSSRVEATGALPVRGMVVDGAVSAERLGAEAGTTDRVEASLAATRAVSGALRLSLSASALTTSGEAPAVGGRTLYWSPRGYLQAQLGAALRRTVAPAVEVELRAAPGVAWVDERTAGRRFTGRGLLPAAALGGEVRYGTAAWSLAGSVDWSGVGVHGYRAAGARVYLSRAVGAR